MTKNPFGHDAFKYGIESFLLMYLDKFQFVLGADLETYSQHNDFFNNENPCNIYFILKRPKVTVNPDSISINGKKATLDLFIHVEEKKLECAIDFNFEKAESELNFHTKYK